MSINAPSSGTVLSVNVGARRDIGAKQGSTGIDKRPQDGPVAITVPAMGDSGLAGDAVCDVDHHGGPAQAVYAVERSELDWWGGELGRSLADGCFGENLTVAGIDTTGAVLGERWRVGSVRLVVTTPRIPCATFAVWMEEKGFLKAFTRRSRPGTYLGVLTPGEVRAGDAITIEHRPSHGVTIGDAFRALTLEPQLLPSLLPAGEDLDPELRATALGRLRTQ